MIFQTDFKCLNEFFSFETAFDFICKQIHLSKKKCNGLASIGVIRGVGKLFAELIRIYNISIP